MKPALKLENLSPRQRLALEFLQREGVNDQTVLELFSRLKADPNASILAPLGEIVLTRPWGMTGWPQPVQLVAGPFGAGKTSVTLRLGLLLRKEFPEVRICLVSADARRGSGRLLLRHYAELSDMAYREATTTLELTACLHAAEEEGYDRIFVDLPGLSRRTFLKTLLADAGLDATPAKAAVHLVLSPHYGEEALADILDRYACGQPGSLIWTKLDEAEHFGQMVNAALRTGLPVSALSHGPGLGNSLVPAQDTTIWRLLFKKELP
jgi:flagellar biosynthesis protein FlhF